MKKLIAIMLVLLPMIAWGQHSENLKVLGIPLGISETEFVDSLLSIGGVEITPQPHFSNSREFCVKNSNDVIGYISIYYGNDDIRSVYLANVVNLKNAGINSLSTKYGQPNIEFDTYTRYEQVGRQYRHTEIHTDLTPEYVWYLPNARISYVKKFGCCFATNGEETWYDSITYLDYISYRKTFPSLLNLL